ncbi:MAG: hypothetical protein OXT09_31445 [Myxococcales bacterium]|nr:hypothetical protein [Myxococcales bacterium]
MGEPAESFRALTRVALCLLAVGVLLPGAAQADGRGKREPHPLAFGVAGGLLFPSGDACSVDVDVVACSSAPPFAGVDLSLRYGLIDILGVGVRAGVAKDLDASETSGNDGPRLDPSDQLLWRVGGEGRLRLPLLPALWVSGEVGLALLHESAERLDDGGRPVEDSAERAALLLALGAGLDVHLGTAVLLTPELRASFISLDDASELHPGAETHDYEATPWIELGLRLSVLP